MFKLHSIREPLDGYSRRSQPDRSHARRILNTFLRSFQHWSRLVYQRWLQDCQVQHQNIHFQRNSNRIGMIRHLRWKPICAFLIREHNQIWRRIQEHSHSWNPIRLVERMSDQQVDQMCNELLVESKVYLCMWQSFRLFKFIIWIILNFELRAYSDDTQPDFKLWNFLRGMHCEYHMNPNQSGSSKFLWYYHMLAYNHLRGKLHPEKNKLYLWKILRLKVGF